MDRSDTPNEIVEKLLLEGQAAVRPWHRIGELLDDVEKTQAWRGTAGSFTAWIRTTAPKLGLKEASLWRYLRSYRSYSTLRQDLQARGYVIPELNALPVIVSAENIELFEKLRRAAPEDVTDPIALRLVRGQALREELRTLWLDYRPALAGRTAKGSGAARPRADKQAPDVAQALGEAQGLLALRQGSREWTGYSAPDVYEVFGRVLMPVSPSSRAAFTRAEVDAIVAVRGDAQAALQFHAFEIRRQALHGDLDRWISLVAPYVDFVWLALLGSAGQTDTMALDPYVGIVEITGARLRVYRPARSLANGGVQTGDLAKALLTSLLRHK